MFIDHTKKFIFVAVPKTATTTMQFFFNGHCNNKYNPGVHPYFMEWYHLSLDQIIDLEPLIHDYFSFGFTRNPWDRMVSSWLEFTQDPGHIAVWSDGLSTDFKDFEDFVINFSKTRWAQDIHFHTSSWYLHNNLTADFIGRYENINEDFKKILTKLGFNEFDIVDTHKYRKTNRSNDYSNYYINNKMVDAVGTYFHDDIVNFGYTF